MWISGISSKHLPIQNQQIEALQKDAKYVQR